MIPTSSSELPGIAHRARRQVEEVAVLFDEGDDAHALWRPDPTRWSLTGHLAHLVIVNGAYLEALEASVDGAIARGRPAGDGPWKHPFVSRWFVRSMEPPPKRRIRTFRAMVPDPGAEPGATLAAFSALQERLAALAERAGGVDLGRLRFGSPFFSLLRLSGGAGFGLILSHNDRHIWLMHEVNRMRAEG